MRRVRLFACAFFAAISVMACARAKPSVEADAEAPDAASVQERALVVPDAGVALVPNGHSGSSPDPARAPLVPNAAVRSQIARLSDDRVR